MNKTIFDAIEKQPLEGQKGFLEASKNAPIPKDISFFDDIKDYGKTILKGTVEGLTRFGRMMGPTLESNKPSSQLLEEQTETLEELLPTDEGFVQRGLRRGLREAPSVMGFPGSTINTLPRAISAGFIGEGAKELGLPEWAQTAAELTAYIGPDITKKLIESGKNAEIIKKARELGLSDEAITPLIQSNFKQKWLSKLIPKRGSTEKALSQSKAELSEAYNTIQNSENAALELANPDKDKLMKSLFEKFQDMPDKVRKSIRNDLADLINNPITGKSLINFFKDVNSNLGPKTKQLSLLKDPIKDALYTISPELGQDFDLINKLHSKFYPIARKLKPNIADDIVKAAESIGLLGSIFTANYPTMIGVLGELGTRKLAQQLIINPRLQQFSSKMVEALNQHKYGMAVKVGKLIKEEIKKFDPKISSKIEDLSKEDYERIFNPLKSQKLK